MSISNGAKNRGGGRGCIGSVGVVFIVFLSAVIVLGALGVYAFNSPRVRIGILDRKLNKMSGYDYSSDIAALMAEKRYEESSKLASFVASHPELPGQEAVRELREELDERTKKGSSLLERGFGLLTGFLSGGGKSEEERIGGLIANVLVDGRGLSEADFPKKTKVDADELASALKKANLSLDKVWFPGVARTLRLSGLLSDEYRDFLVKSAKESEAAKEATAELTSAIADTRALISELGLHRALGVHGEVRTPSDLSAIVKWARLLPAETYIVATHGGVRLLHRLPDPLEGKALLLEIAKKGPPAIRSAGFWLK